jgi:3-isopropylmalate dehydratase small subunit
LGRTLAEKILSSESTSDLEAGDIAIAKVDLVFIQDTTSPLAVRQFESVGFKTLADQKMTLIFLRNAINVGLPVFICDTSKIEDGDELEVDLDVSMVHDPSNGVQLSSGCIPEVMLRILEKDGLVEYIKKYGDFEVKAK